MKGSRELDVLLALCDAAPLVTKIDHASKMVSQLSPYLPESHSQCFRPSPFLYDLKPSPWEKLTYKLTSSLLSLGSNFPPLRSTTLSAINEYLYSCADAIDAITPLQRYDSAGDKFGSVQEHKRILSLAVSLVGFLEASAQFPSLWSASEKLQIVEHVRSMLSESFMVAIETASSTVRNASLADPTLRDWRRYTRQYAANRRPLGAMLLQQGFMRFVKSCATSLVGAQNLSDEELLDDYMNGVGIARSSDDAEITLIDRITEIIADEIQLLEDGSDYLQLGSPLQKQLTFSVKAFALIGYLNCVILSGNAANSGAFLSWLEDTLADPNQMASLELATATLKSIAIISRMSLASASSGSRSLLRFIIEGCVLGEYTGSVAGKCLAQVLGILSQDAVITTLYSLGNALSPGSGSDKYYHSQLLNENARQADSVSSVPPPIGIGSTVSISAIGDHDNATCRNILRAIVTIAVSSNDEKISALAQSMLLQKIGKVNIAVDALIIRETASLSLSTGQADFQLLLKFYDRAYQDSIARNFSDVTNAVKGAMAYISLTLRRDSPLFRVYLVHLLECIVNKGDAVSESERQKEVVLAPEAISFLLRPLALLISSDEGGAETQQTDVIYDEDVTALFRDAWFNISVHGISTQSAVTRSHIRELRLLAKNSPPLIAESRLEMLESDVELNTILRRGMSPQRLIELKRILMAELPDCESGIKHLNYPKVVFLNASLLVESLRASSGNCTKVLNYFRDPALTTADMASCMSSIADKVVADYLSLTLSADDENFSVPYLSKELAQFFMACCHRIERVQSVAMLCADKIIRECPSALCDKHSLFALLELLTVMWLSCLEEELDEFEWKASYASPMGIVKVDLADDYNARKRTLNTLLERAKAWVAAVIDIAPLDTYLSISNDTVDGSHISLGRSFALDMGSTIPRSDQRLGKLLFLHSPKCPNEFLGSFQSFGISRVNVASDFIAQYTIRQQYRAPDPLATKYLEQGSEKSKAAAILCGSDYFQPSILHHLVILPFQLFSEESMNMGVALWLGAIYENPKLGPRILAEAIEAWEETIQRRKGLFDRSFDYVDPMYTKIELLPSDKALLLKKQQKAQATLAPHLIALRFFESHFNAVRLNSAQNRRLFSRLIDRTTVGLLQTSGHPLARELHFRIVLFGLRVIQDSFQPEKVAWWKLNDQLLSAALDWFKHPPRWSFGGNRLQVKAEDQILDDVSRYLRRLSGVPSHTRDNFKPLQLKYDLLQLLIEHERSRLRVWLYPLEGDRKHFQISGNRNSAEMKNDIRSLLLDFPEKALDEPSSLELMLGAALPSDVSFQLKLVQALRYDALGYVERYILETAKQSQLFAHQVIWNMKANSYKDEDSQIPDPLKPTLDRFMDTLISSFSDEERDFYEREFSFFNDITGISGKLRPYIKKSKPEKKAKIEEELRKIKVEIGVYLPSNPDGVVVGIDRKSGKPLQSHAKAPYMATFRIQKTRTRGDERESQGQSRSSTAGHDASTKTLSAPLHSPSSQETYEVWQSAIFKVGDDCRQDMLALQMIAAFRSIFASAGLDVWVFPYRVTSTAPGCGVIDVLPNSISRDMLGREAVNGLYDYFISKYGGEHSMRFQEARTNFVKSMAAYSVISYLLQFKDRHNGNIMIDDAGHIIHIDFGFCFDIAPGGVRFERAPFKLTSEMVAVMSGTSHPHIHSHSGSNGGLGLPGGHSNNPTSTQPYRWFESLVIKAFLASRPFCTKLSHIVSLMLDSGLPCFKPDTLKNFRDRFVLEKNEREAAEYMRELIRKSYMSVSTKGYDQFQLLTNGIPY
ncbi:phosphatidylinositol 4-kinase (STT4), putative [Aspergillus fumigatus A1163]|uniref:1-phosphatidylinositol 4-kinase n=1 Tax=Aspergillus fumigatus (strain CBS 144.89 / FGSC A1163 / CEA10) TaxID=451804 RepID=B0YC85_ASPFC|nr:phosphatidylinositol 4-kinase (STT4), putative [Aspergillus fumigatus A1163]